MNASIYDIALPTLLHALGNLSAVLDKASSHCEQEKIDPSVLLSARLYPDMFALSRQVQVVSDTAKGGAARLAGVEPPKFADTETSFAELKARLDKTATFVKGIEAAPSHGAEDRPIEVKSPQAPPPLSACSPATGPLATLTRPGSARCGTTRWATRASPTQPGEATSRTMRSNSGTGPGGTQPGCSPPGRAPTWRPSWPMTRPSRLT